MRSFGAVHVHHIQSLASVQDQRQGSEKIRELEELMHTSGLTCMLKF